MNIEEKEKLKLEIIEEIKRDFYIFPKQTNESGVPSQLESGLTKRESWKVDDDIYEPNIEQMPLPDFKEIATTVTKNLVSSIEEIYQVSASLDVVEEYIEKIIDTINEISEKLEELGYPVDSLTDPNWVMRMEKEIFQSEDEKNIPVGNPIPES